jgi:hypothetical protein
MRNALVVGGHFWMKQVGPKVQEVNKNEKNSQNLE